MNQKKFRVFPKVLTDAHFTLFPKNFISLKFSVLWTVFLCFTLVNASPASKSSVFRRLAADSVHSTRCATLCHQDAAVLRNRHRCVFAEGKLHFLSLKTRKQSAHGYYQGTALCGGYLSSYDLIANSLRNSTPLNNRAEIDPLAAAATSAWTHAHFEPIDKNDNLQEAFFALNNLLFLFVYTRYENVTFRSLHYASTTPRSQRIDWTRIDLQVDASSQFIDGEARNGNLAWTVVEERDEDIDIVEQHFNTSTRTVYLAATDGWGRLIVSEMKVDFDANSNRPLSAQIRTVATDERSRIDSGGAIVALAYRRRQLFAFYGTRGCGFHWKQHESLVVDLSAADNENLTAADSRSRVRYLNITSRNTKNGHPPWSFNGPMLVEQSGNMLYMMGGSVPAASGATGTDFNREVWNFNMDTALWRKSERALVPETLNAYEMCSAIDRVNEKLYLADFRNGIYAAHTRSM